MSAKKGRCGCWLLSAFQLKQSQMMHRARPQHCCAIMYVLAQLLNVERRHSIVIVRCIIISEGQGGLPAQRARESSIFA